MNVEVGGGICVSSRLNFFENKVMEEFNEKVVETCVRSVKITKRVILMGKTGMELDALAKYLAEDICNTEYVLSGGGNKSYEDLGKNGQIVSKNFGQTQDCGKFIDGEFINLCRQVKNHPSASSDTLTRLLTTAEKQLTRENADKIVGKFLDYAIKKGVGYRANLEFYKIKNCEKLKYYINQGIPVSTISENIGEDFYKILKDDDEVIQLLSTNINKPHDPPKERYLPKDCLVRLFLLHANEVLDRYKESMVVYGVRMKKEVLENLKKTYEDDKDNPVIPILENEIEKITKNRNTKTILSYLMQIYSELVMKRFVIIISEIDRESILLLDYRKRNMPANLYIIATMSNADYTSDDEWFEVYDLRSETLTNDSPGGGREPEPPAGMGKPEREPLTIHRIKRNPALSRRVKETFYDNKCQICGNTVSLCDGQTYAEGHHIRPLGDPHNGDDLIENIICVCPNHHVQLDRGAILLNVDEFELKIHEEHKMSTKYVDYHNKHIYGNVPLETLDFVNELRESEIFP
jgi:hypothetical protein